MKKFVPHFIAVGIFIAISAIYFSPIFEGKILAAHDLNDDYFKKVYSERNLYLSK